MCISKEYRGIVVIVRSIAMTINRDRVEIYIYVSIYGPN